MCSPKLVVLDTNLVLDLFLFADPAVQPLMVALADSGLRWICTEVMQQELRRVLDYPQIRKGLAKSGRTAEQVETEAARYWVQVPEPVATHHGVRCKDRDDQMFVDLAIAHQACLLSKDHAVLALSKPLRRWRVSVSRRWE